ncbi:MAG: hypothetical protein DHS80DRAFT_25313 [Piptocephalis tieghemiana]|nr:MAG: hypothetical protein DHS80DRAFT_25313 [Piptocephalis tieghemiana]
MHAYLELTLSILLFSSVLGDNVDFGSTRHVGEKDPIPGLNKYIPNWANITDGVYTIQSAYDPWTFNCLETDGKKLYVSPCSGNFGKDTQRFNIVTSNDGQYVQIQSYRFRNEAKSCITGSPKPDQVAVYIDQCYQTNVLYGNAPSYWFLPFGGVEGQNNQFLRFKVSKESTNFLSYHPDNGVQSFTASENNTDTTLRTYWVAVPAYNW